MHVFVHFVCSCHCSIGDDDVHRMNCVPQSIAASPNDGNSTMTSAFSSPTISMSDH